MIEISLHQFGLAEEACLDNLVCLELGLCSDCVETLVELIGKILVAYLSGIKFGIKAKNRMTMLTKIEP